MVYPLKGVALVITFMMVPRTRPASEFQLTWSPTRNLLFIRHLCPPYEERKRNAASVPSAPVAVGIRTSARFSTRLVQSRKEWDSNVSAYQWSNEDDLRLLRVECSSASRIHPSRTRFRSLPRDAPHRHRLRWRACRSYGRACRRRLGGWR